MRFEVDDEVKARVTLSGKRRVHTGTVPSMYTSGERQFLRIRFGYPEHAGTAFQIALAVDRLISADRARLVKRPIRTIGEFFRKVEGLCSAS